MKAKTRLQKAVAGSIKTLPPLSDHQRKEAISLMPHIAKRNSKGECTCLDCAHSWTAENRSETIVCPNCGRTLQVETDRKINAKYSDYFAVVTRCNGFQVVRMYLVKAILRKGEKAEYSFLEAFQRWIDAEGNNVIVGKSRHFLCHYIDVWNLASDMEIRTEHEVHTIIPSAVIGKMSVIPQLKRNGFFALAKRQADYKGNFHDINPYRLFNGLLRNPKYETLIKSGQIPLLQHFIKSDYKFEHYWPMIRIAIRNRYKVKDATLWTDLIDALEHCGKDTRNAKYICPTNLKAAHDHWNKKREEKQRKEREIRERERYLADLKQREIISHSVDELKVDESNYIKAKSRFFDIAISDGTITIKVLDSVKAFFDEGAYLHHCVAANKYYNKENSLILSAIVNGKPMETIELSLSTLEVLQCRGVHNSNTDYHDRILNLMKANIQEVAKRLRA